MVKANGMRALTLAALLGLGVTGAGSIFTEARAAETPEKTARQEVISSTTDDADGVMSYKDKKSGKTFVSEDQGETWVSEEEYEKKHPAVNYEWWTYDQYKAWLEQEKKTLQEMADEHTQVETSAGAFVWTQEMTDQLLAEYEQTLADIKEGVLVSKSVNGEQECQAVYNPNWVESVTD